MRDLRIGVAVIACLLSACADAVPEWCAVPGDASLQVAGDPVWDGPLELTPAWRVEGGEPGSELLWPTDVAVNAGAPMIALADFGLGEVVVVGSGGGRVDRWGRRGQGPGELALPAAAAWRGNGELVVYDPGNSKIVVFDSSGAAAGEEAVGVRFVAALGGGASWMRINAAGTLLAQAAPRFQEEDDAMRTFVVVRGRDGGAVVDTLVSTRIAVATAPGMAPLAAPGWQKPLAAMSGDSVHATAGDQAEYVVRVYHEDSPAHVICRDVAPLPYAAEEGAASDENIPDFVRQAVEATPPPDAPAAIGRLVYDAAGRLWVERSRPRALSGLDAAAGRPGAVLDVYDADGRYLGEARMPAGVRFVDATHDLVLGLESSELGVLSLAAYHPAW